MSTCAYTWKNLSTKYFLCGLGLDCLAYQQAYHNSCSAIPVVVTLRLTSV